MDLKFLSTPQRKLAEDIIRQCAMSRVWFVENVLGVTVIEKWQRKVLEDLDAGYTKISIRSGHGVGKTALCSWIGLHFLLFREDVKVAVTAPAKDQLKDGLIPEVNKWIQRLPEWMSKSLDPTSERVTRHPHPSNHFVSFRTARAEKPDALQGIHATNTMIIVDEAAGVDESIYEAGMGSLSTKGAIAILIGNPTNASGFFYKTQHDLAHMWKVYHVSCMDSTRVDQDYINTQALTYGVDSVQYRVRVLGQFPDSAVDTVIPRGYAESALNRSIEPLRSGRIWGIDPGRGGDPTGFCDRSMNAIHDLRELKYADTMQVVGWIKKRWDDTTPRYRPETIYIDAIGLGAGVADRLAEMNLPVYHVNVAEGASESERFIRLKPELWYMVREWLEGKDVTFKEIHDPSLAKKLVDELCVVREKLLSTGKMDVESKAELKKRGVRSTNLADALVVTFAEGGVIVNGQYDNVYASTNIDTLKYRAPGVF